MTLCHAFADFKGLKKRYANGRNEDRRAMRFLLFFVGIFVTICILYILTNTKLQKIVKKSKIFQVLDTEKGEL